MKFKHTNLSKISKITTITSSGLIWLKFAGMVFAQSSTESAAKGGTGGALPDAGSTGFTYIIFLTGVVLFVFGTLKLIQSYRQ